MLKPITKPETLVSPATLVAPELSEAHEPLVPPVEGETGTFKTLGLSQTVLDVLDRMGFVIPTPIQERAIPIGLKKQDLIGIAQTGTGKTLAFGLPILNAFVTKKSSGRTLILLPTRELALQVEEALGAIGRHFRLKAAVLIGGAPIRMQLQQLRQNPDIIIATPGRLIDHLQQGSVDLRAVDTLVLDEADRMLDMGFAPQIKQILKSTPPERQTMLFSATMPDAIVAMTREFMKDPQRVEIQRPGTMAENVSQEIYVVAQEAKDELLAKILYEATGPVLVFARTRSRARKVARVINNWDIRAAEIHADRTLVQRRQALDGFKSGRYRVLVATDIAARGIDVEDLPLVVNYDLPDAADDYVHRIGRTGRAGKSGHAISFAAPDQWRDVRDIEKTISKEIAIAEGSQGQFDQPTRQPSRGRSGGPRRGGYGGGNRGGSSSGGRRPARTY